MLTFYRATSGGQRHSDLQSGPIVWEIVWDVCEQRGQPQDKCKYASVLFMYYLLKDFCVLNRGGNNSY